MKRLFMVGLTVLACTSFAQAEIWCGKTKHPGDVTLWIENVTAFESGNNLYADCTSTETFNKAKCLGYIMSTSDVLGAQNANAVCEPKEVVIGQVVDVVKKYLGEHPETRHYTATSQIAAALSAAFPCVSPNQTPPVQ